MSLQTETRTTSTDSAALGAALVHSEAVLADAERLLNAKLRDATGRRLLSRREYCALLGISESTSERWHRDGFGPVPVKIGPRRVGYRLADVLAFITARQRAS